MMQRQSCLFSETIEFSSPEVRQVYPDRKSAKKSNKQDLEQYVHDLLDKFSDISFALKDVIVWESNVIFMLLLQLH